MGSEDSLSDCERYEAIVSKLDNDSVRLESKSADSGACHSLVFYVEDMGELFGDITFSELSEIASDYEADSIVCFSYVEGAENRIWRFDEDGIIMKSLSAFKEGNQNDYRDLVGKLSRKKPEILENVGIEPNEMNYIH